MAIEISLIVACRNERKDIGRCLAAIANQSLPQSKFEAIFVDGNSDDGTFEEISLFKKKVKNLRAMRETGPARSAANARNQGARMARGKVLVFYDADVVADKEFLYEINRAMRQGFDAASAAARPLPTKSMWAILRNHETMASNYLVKKGEGSNFLNILTKKTFDALGGYEPGFRYGEDLRLLDKLRNIRAKTIHIPRAIAYHKDPDSLNEIAAQSEFYGRGFKALFLSDPARHSPRLALVGARALWLPLFLVYIAIPFNLLLFLVGLFYFATIVDGLFVMYRSLKMGGDLKYAIFLIPFRMIRSFYFLKGFCADMLK